MTTPTPGAAAVPEGLVSAVVDLVRTGPVLLGAYTLAELTVVDAIVDFLEAAPSDEVIAEAVRSLAARQLLVPGGADGRVQVRGDLGIAVTFQQRARLVLDARATGTQPGEPWRILLLPQPEGICLLIRIDALGVHELGLYETPDALERVAGWLPQGEQAETPEGTTAEQAIAAASRSALVSVTRYAAEGSAETAGETRDLVVAVTDERRLVFTRAAAGQPLAPAAVDGEITETLARMLA